MPQLDKFILHTRIGIWGFLNVEQNSDIHRVKKLYEHRIRNGNIAGQ